MCSMYTIYDSLFPIKLNDNKISKNSTLVLQCETTGTMNGPQLDAAILFSKATTQHLDDLDNEVTHNYIYTLALITASLNTVSFLLNYSLMRVRF